MSDLLLHPQSRQAIEAFLKKPSHALLLSGPVGFGKHTIAQHIAKRLGSDLQLYDAVTDATGIDEIRDILRLAKYKRSAAQAVTFVVTGADVLGAEAQNALLKILEEPPEATYFILTASSPKLLLPTIFSRTQQITLLPPAGQKLADYFVKVGHSTERVEQALRISGGLPGLTAAILHNDTHPFLETIQQVKHFLSSEPFERLLHVERLAKERAHAMVFAQGLVHVCRAALAHAAGQNNNTAVRSWANRAQNALYVSEAMAANVNVKVALDYASLHL